MFVYIITQFITHIGASTTLFLFRLFFVEADNVCMASARGACKRRAATTRATLITPRGRWQARNSLVHEYANSYLILLEEGGGREGRPV